MRKTALFMDPLFICHDPGFDHPESPNRLKVIHEVLDDPKIKTNFVYPEFTAAAYKTVALNHSTELVNRVAETAGKIFDSLDPDTKTSPDSYAAAMLAVGALTTGIDLLQNKDIDNGFAMIRPPGHHAEKKQSMGFCLFNNVAIAARYAIKQYGIKRIMIVDWDLHHGNGTQNAFYETDKVLYVSTHQYPYYPGTGNVEETGKGKGKGFTVNIPLPGYQGDMEYASIFNNIVVPIAREYKPELILVSCGFDIYKDDPLGLMQVTAPGFAYLTRSLVSLAEEMCTGKILVTLEGGYDLTGQRDGALAVISELCGKQLQSPFPVDLSDDYAAQLSANQETYTAVEQAMNVAKRMWKL